MENIKKLGSLIDKATSDAHDRIPEPLQQEILILINSRADMYHPTDLGPSMPSIAFQKGWPSRTRKSS